MIELPEAVTIARQLNETVPAKQIQAVICGHTPHKFAFYTRSAEEYNQLLAGTNLGLAGHHGSLITLHAGDDRLLVLGYGGERILYHPDPSTIPAKHQLLLSFSGGDALSVTVQGWGFCQLLLEDELGAHPYLNKPGPDPLEDGFTADHFESLFETLDPKSKSPLKFFLISEPGVLGIGNGCLQDILFNARLDPRRSAASLTAEERNVLHMAMRSTLAEMTHLDGRNSERDLFNNPGGYPRLLAADKVGRPCPRCTTPIQKFSFLGGAIYICPTCQK